MRGSAIGADFYEIWNTTRAVPTLTSAEAREPNERDFMIMPVTGHLLRIIDIFPLQDDDQDRTDPRDASPLTGAGNGDLWPGSDLDPETKP